MISVPSFKITAFEVVDPISIPNVYMFEPLMNHFNNGYEWFLLIVYFLSIQSKIKIDISVCWYSSIQAGA